MLRIIIQFLLISFWLVVPARSEPPLGQEPEQEHRPAEMLSPVNESELKGSNILFEWTDTPKASYWLQVGTSLGAKDIFSKLLDHGHSVTVPEVPLNGQTIYVRLWTNIKEHWFYRDYKYTTQDAGVKPVEMMSPLNGAMLTSSKIEFRWSPGQGVSEYWLYVGNRPGRKDIYFSNTLRQPSITVNDVPLNGKLVYVRLWFKFNGRWKFKDYIYSTDKQSNFSESDHPIAAHGWMISPANDSVLSGPDTVFQWRPVSGASEYRLKVGVTPGLGNILKQSFGQKTSAVVKNIDQNLDRVYVRLQAKIDGQWVNDDYMYLTNKSEVELAHMIDPPPGTLLDSSRVEFEWTSSLDASSVELSIGSRQGGHDIYQKSFEKEHGGIVEGLPMDGKVLYVRLASRIHDDWFYEEYIYGTLDLNLDPAVIVAPLPGTILTKSKVQFEWKPNADAEEYRLEVGTEKGNSDIFARNLGGQAWAIVENVPQSGRSVFVRVWSKIYDEWVYADYEYKTKRLKKASAKITRVVYTSDTVKASMIFEWNEGKGVTQYRLSVGSGPGRNDIFDAGLGQQTQVTVTDINARLERIYWRLWSGQEGNWRYKDYVYDGETGSWKLQ